MQSRRSVRWSSQAMAQISEAGNDELEERPAAPAPRPPTAGASVMAGALRAILEAEAAAHSALCSQIVMNVSFMSRIFAYLSLLDRIRLIGVSRQWDSLLLRELRFEEAAPSHGRQVTAASLALLCRRAGASLRVLDITRAPCCQRLLARDILAALRQIPAAEHQLSDLVCWRVQRRGLFQAYPHFSKAELDSVEESCPSLRHAVCSLRARNGEEGYAMLGRLPGQFHLRLMLRNEPDLAAALAAQTALTSWDASGNALRPGELGALGAEFLAAQLVESSALTELQLAFNGIGTEGARFFSAALAANAPLQTLNLDQNQLGDGGAALLGDALSSSTSLTALSVAFNGIGDGGITALVAALASRNTTLARLDVKGNSIGMHGGEAIAAALCTNVGLTSLNLWGNQARPTWS